MAAAQVVDERTADPKVARALPSEFQQLLGACRTAFGEKRAKEVGCAHGDDCKATCDKLHASPVCLAEMKEFEKCFLEEPTDHWTCDEERLPVVKDTFCAKERATVVDCLQRTPPPTIPSK